MKVEARDPKGNIFIKNVRLVQGKDGLVIDFGWPCQYYVKDIERHYPFKKPLCIDSGGRNHNGFGPVTVSARDMNRIFDTLVFRKEY